MNFPASGILRFHFSFFLFFFFFFLHAFQFLETKCTVHALFTHCSQDPQPLYLEKISKIGLTVLFTHLKIILL